jgi:hypothetical protein
MVKYCCWFWGFFDKFVWFYCLEEIDAIIFAAEDGLFGNFNGNYQGRIIYYW